ncbi:MAG: SDR family oxidoreductase [Bacteroidales bacterium]|nr:MAG: SDR family oxidoreductase [Bacteroidales bacterium]
MNIIITGASKGIGFEVARKCAALGDNNIIAIARTEERLKNLKSACIRENIQAHLYPVVFDLEKLDSYESLIKEIKNHFNEVDVLINNAGLLINKPFEKLSSSDISRMIQLNLSAPVHLIQSIIPLMKKPCHVVNISSMGGFQGSQKFPGLAIYSAAKAGLASLTECLAEEYKGSGLSFNCLAIGATDTEMLREAFPGYDAPFNASDIAEFIADFALNKYKFFNGKIIPVTVSTP